MYAEGVGLPRDLSAAIDWFHQAAADGNAAAYYNLGVMHLSGLGVPQDPQAAERFFFKAANRGSAEACVALGLFYAQGEHRAPDHQAALASFAEAARLGSLDGACNLGLFHIRGQGTPPDAAEGLRILEDAAGKGSLSAMWALHNLYSEGRHIQADLQIAQSWLLCAAEAANGAAACKLAAQLDTHHPHVLPIDRVIGLLLLAAEADELDAQQQLGRLYIEERHTPKNLEEALRWFGRAAMLGDPYSQAWLGDMLSTGDGVDHDREAAMAWYRKAAEGGFTPALDILTGEPQTSPEDERAIFQLWLARAQAGEAAAQRVVGDLTLKGAGTEPSAAEAVGWLRKAADQGDVTAKIILAGIYLQNQAEPRDEYEPIALLLEAAEQGDADAQYNLGVCFQQGACVPRDPAKAEELYRQAANRHQSRAPLALADLLLETSDGRADKEAEAFRWYGVSAEGGSSRAMFTLGWLCEQGRGTPQDLVRARQHYQSAADLGSTEGREALHRLADQQQQVGRSA
jgi:hypothetical protein